MLNCGMNSRKRRAARAYGGSTAAVALVAAALAAPSDLQAVLVLDLRLADGGKSTEALPGQVIPLKFYAIIQGTDGIDNELLYSTMAILRSSTEAPLGDFAQPVLLAPFATGAAQGGSLIDADGDGDLDVGGCQNADSTFFYARSDVFRPSQGTRVTFNNNPDSEQYLLADVMFTLRPELPTLLDSSVDAAGGQVQLNALRAPTRFLETAALYVQDGASGNRTVTGVLPGLPVVITVVPEPAAAILGLAVCGWRCFRPGTRRVRV